MRDLMTSTNTYVKERATLEQDGILLRNIAMYLTDMLKVVKSSSTTF